MPPARLDVYYSPENNVKPVLVKIFLEIELFCSLFLKRNDLNGFMLF